MGQARADSVPMLVISGVNATDTLGKGFGHLHELPDQRGMVEKVALSSRRITKAEELPAALADAFALFASARPGPVHIEIPIDVMTLSAGLPFAIAGERHSARAGGPTDCQGSRPGRESRPAADPRRRRQRKGGDCA